MANEKQIDKICRMLDDLITKSKRDTNSEPVKEQIKSPDFYEGYKIGFESAQPKWISVEDELPPVGEKVLVCANNVRLMAFIDCEDVWHRDTITYRLPGEVTHWMPLPEPPKEEA